MTKDDLTGLCRDALVVLEVNEEQTIYRVLHGDFLCWILEGLVSINKTTGECKGAKVISTSQASIPKEYPYEYFGYLLRLAKSKSELDRIRLIDELDQRRAEYGI